MLNERHPDSVPNSFSGDTAQESGARNNTCQKFTINDLKNQSLSFSGAVEEPPNLLDLKKAESGENNKKNQTGGRFTGTGNRCGHNPDFPRDVHFKAQEKRPFIIQKMLSAADRLNRRPSKKGLNGRTPKSVHSEELILTRSEGRESLVQFLKKMLYSLELSTMTVRTNDVNFAKPTLKDMTADVVLTGLSHTRAKRAQQKLVEMGYLKVIRSPKYVNGEFKADPSVREVTPKLFKALGLGQEYDFQRHVKTKRLEKRTAKTGFQRELFLKLREAVDTGKKTGIKTGSFPENRAQRARLVGLYVEVCRRKSPDTSTAMLRACAEKMDIQSLEKMIKHHQTTVDTS